MLRSRKARLILLGAVVVLALAIGGVAVAMGSDSETTPAATAPNLSPTPAAWPTNANGQTYGSSAGAQPGEEPDLIAVEATNGKEGYCLKGELNHPYNGLDRDEATAEAMNKAALSGRTIPVYESDGTTEIGEFQCGGPGSKIGHTKVDGTTVTQWARQDGTIVTVTKNPDGKVVSKTLEALDGTITTIE